MATVTLTGRFQQLGRAPDNLLRSYSDTEVTRSTSTQFIYRHEDNSPFEGFRVIVSGSGFTYRNGDPTGGTISSVTIVNQNGQTVATVGFSPTSSRKTLDDFFDSAASSGSSAWSYLLSGNDVINGTSASDGRWPAGSKAGNETYNGAGGEDSFVWEVGRERYNGGSGYDLLSYRRMPEIVGTGEFTGVVIDASARTAVDPRGIMDRFTSIEAFEGSRYRDQYVGADLTWDRFAGLRGADVIYGGGKSEVAGQTTRDNFDMVLHWQDYWDGGRRGISADLETGFVDGSIRGRIRDGFGTFDTVSDIEGVGGTRYNDIFRGSRSDNWFVGGEGRDSYVGEAGRDRIMFDEWFGTRAPAGVTVDLGRASGQIIDDGFGNTETALGIENITSGRAADRLTGNGVGNELRGQGGNDVLTGRGGNDRLFAGSGADKLNGGLGRDALHGGTDALGDVFIFSRISDSSVGQNRDVIHNFTRGADDIDLRAIDARPSSAADNAFVWGGTTAGAYSVWWQDSAGNAVLVSVDTNGNTAADLEILVNGTSSLTANNFLL